MVVTTEDYCQGRQYSVVTKKLKLNHYFGNLHRRDAHTIVGSVRVAPQLARQINNQGRDDHTHVDPAESYLNAIAEIIKRFRFRQFFPLRVCSVSQRPPFLQSP